MFFSVRPATVAILYAALASGCGRGPAGDVFSCEIPYAPVLCPVHEGARLVFATPSGFDIEVGTSTHEGATAPESWQGSSEVVLPSGCSPCLVKVFARSSDPDCGPSDVFAHVYDVRDGYPPAAGLEGSTAVSMDDLSIVAWATGWDDPVEYGRDVTTTWRTPERALGPAEGTSAGVVSLGEGGRIVVTFDAPIADGDGFDLVVFENGLNASFLELAFVEVSTDGDTFARFGSAYLGSDLVGTYGSVDTTLVGQIAGKYEQGWGTPFDLADLGAHPLVQSGDVALDSILFVRIQDIEGDGSVTDDFGEPIYDPWPTTDSAGFDLDAVGAIHLAP